MTYTMGKINLAILICLVAGVNTALTAQNAIKFTIDRNMNTQGSSARVIIQEDNLPALLFGEPYKTQSMMFFWLKEEQCSGKKLRVSAMVKGMELTRNFIFGIQIQKDGKPAWPNGTGASGSFDWRPFSFELDFEKLGVESGAIRIGLQNTEGKVLFRDLLIEEIGSPTNEKTDTTKQTSAYSGKYGSIDFSHNRFCIPDFNASRNLIQNPSFVDGLDFWTRSNLDRTALVVREDGAPLLTLDNTTAVDGCHSLRQEVLQNHATAPATFAIPLEQGGEYTLSFHAKTDSPETARLSVGGVTCRWDTFLPRLRYRLGAEWQRYTYTFKSPGKIVQIYIGGARGAAPCRIWLDAIQLEKGNQATEFTRRPASVSMRSNTSNNVSEPGTNAGIRLLPSSRVPGKGTLKYTVRDFFGNEKFSGISPFETTAADTPVEIPLPACDVLPSGSYVVETTIELSDGFSHSARHRFARMQFMDGTHKHKRLFSAAGVHTNDGTFEALIKLFWQMGVGSSCIFETPPEQYQELLRKYDIEYYTELFRHSGWPPTITGLPFNLKSTVNRGQNNGVMHMSDEDVTILIKHALETVSMNPDVKVYKTINEPFMQTEEEIARTVKILKRIKNAVQEIHPDVKFLTPDPANIDHSMSYLETFFKHGGAEACDIVGVHLYRGNPDYMDEDLVKLFGIIDRYMPEAKLWSTEGGYYNTWIIPDLGFSHVTHGGDHYRAGNTSYDIGLGERIATAYQIRYRIQSLKHANRLIIDQDWNLTTADRTYFGIAGIPTSLAFTVNTPARLLGNADFVANLALPKELRGYLFKDEKNRPVAALWSTNSDTLYKNHPPAIMKASGLGNVDVFNLMCAPESIESGELKLSGFPVFVRGRENSVAELKKAIEAADISFPETGDPLGFTFNFSADGQFKPEFSNRFNRRLKGKLTSMSGSTILLEKDIDLKPFETFIPRFTFPFSKEALSASSFSYIFKADNQSSISHSLKLQYANVKNVNEKTFTMDGNPSKWTSIPGLLTDNIRRDKPDVDVPGDFEVETKWAWNEKFLYMAAFVKDNHFSPSRSIQFPDLGDSITLFFDSFADNMRGARTGESRTSEDDQDYQIWFREDGTLSLIRRRCAHWQLSFSRPGGIRAEGRYAKTDDGYWMEMAIPMAEIQPVKLKNGGVFGMNILINDYDNNKRRGQAYYGQGEVPASWRAPLDYVTLFLQAEKP